MSRARLVGAGVVVLACCGLAVACADVLGIQTLDREQPPTVDAAPDTYRDPCTSDPGPPKPDASDGVAINDPLTFVVTSVDFGLGTGLGGAGKGLNLDHACTLSASANPCVFPDPAGGKKDVSGNGIDDAIHDSLVSPLPLGAPLEKAVELGYSALTLRITDWDGQPDDPSVTGFLGSGRGEALGDGGTDAGFDWKHEVAAGDGVSTRGWVSSGQVVLFFDHFDFIVRVAQLGFSDMVLRLDGPVLVGTIASDHKSVQGTLGGRWQADDAVAALANQFIPFPINTCAGSVAQTALCSSRDIMQKQADDGTGKTCDAVSVGFDFKAQAASWQDVDGGVPPPPKCNNAPTSCN